MDGNKEGGYSVTGVSEIGEGVRKQQQDKSSSHDGLSTWSLYLTIQTTKCLPYCVVRKEVE